MKSVTVIFKDDDDAGFFATYVHEAKKDNGSVAPLYNGLMSSVMRDATVLDRDEIVHSAQILLDALSRGSDTVAVRVAKKNLRLAIEKAGG